MNISPYLSAVQSLKGENPGNKYKELHTIAAQLIENPIEREEFLRTGITNRVQPPLLPHLRILVGNKLKVNDAVIEALKSDDVTIIKQALNAKWFFNTSNKCVNVHNFVSNIIPHISLRTRLELIKILAYCLIEDPIKADEFFSKFADLYGIEQSLPLITACSEQHIYTEILQRKIRLPFRILTLLYRKYPELVIRYLQLGNEKNEKNIDDRKQYKISLTDYIRFLPVLVKHHTSVFIELLECLPSYSEYVKLGNTRAEYFLRNGLDFVIEKPHIALNILSLKFVSNKLTTQQFEIMFTNLFPKNLSDLSITEMMSYLKYYPQDKKFNLLQENIKLIDDQDIQDIYVLFDNPEFVKTLPNNIREEYGQKNYKNDCASLLPPTKCIPILKEVIKKPSDRQRSYWINQMILSCYYYDDKKALVEVLNYYNVRHKNELFTILSEVLTCLLSNFSLKLLDRMHWKELQEIIQRAYIKGDLFLMSSSIYTELLTEALLYYIKNKNEDENMKFLQKLVNILLEGTFEKNFCWNFLADCLEFEEDCLQLFLTMIPQKYPETHFIWKKEGTKCKMTRYLIESINRLDKKNISYYKNKRSNKDTSVEHKIVKKIKIEDYSWLVKLVQNLLKYENNFTDKNMYLEFKSIIRDYDYEFYQNLIDNDPDLINEIRTNDGLAILKRNPNKVLAKWKLYLNACRKYLQHTYGFTKQFVTMIKWHQDIPIKFVDQCIHEIIEKGSFLILGVLLEGEVFGKIVEPYLPKDKTVDINDENAKKIYEITASLPKAMNLTNPPVSFDVVVSLCKGDFVSLAAQTLRNLAQRVPVHRVLTFANHLVDQPVSIKKLGIRLALQVTPKFESYKFLMQIWNQEKNSSIREITAEMIFNVFTQCPNSETWELMRLCIQGLTSDDITTFNILNKIKNVDKKYVALYTQEYFNKLDTKDLKSENKNLLNDLIEEIDLDIALILPEDLITDFAKRYFYSKKYCGNDFYYKMNFLVEYYLFADVSKFDNRLKIFLELLEDFIKMKTDISKNLFDDDFDDDFFSIETRKKSINCVVKAMFDYQLQREEVRTEMNLRVVDEIFDSYLRNFQPWEDPEVYILLIIYKNYWNTMTPEEFGEKCGENISTIIKEFGSELFITNIANVIKKVLQSSRYYRKFEEQLNLKMEVSNGLMKSSEKRLGTLVSIKLMQSLKNRASKIDCITLEKKWKLVEDITVKAAVNECLRTS